MTNGADILELKFEGNGINPSAVKPHEIAELILGFEKSLLATIKENYPEIDTASLLFTFEEIKNESLGLRYKSVPLASHPQNIVLSSFLFISSAISSGNFNRLNRETISGLRVITKFSKKYDCGGSFRRNDEVVSTFSPTTEIVVDRQKLIKEQGTIYGKLIDVGGENPNVHIKIDENNTLIFSTSEANAKKLAPKLFEKVTLSGEIKWNPATLEIIDFKLGAIEDYSPGNASKAIKALRGITSGFWDKFNTDDEINNQLLRD